ncbi:ATP-dependent DNA helicase [Microlunatus elymi]|uniref:ATP-dependent helicase DinG n=2 Tax=Microlunatus elymi TaxID=2596828 RepID=A0A516Q1R9_9ACTN|nr:ATP-dependent DNA helicase [Microlunatus elymi]QDP97161.1 ATP-dependent DNA helicase [Microlunatus elymi]
MKPQPTAQDVLDAAVAKINGQHRPGQAAMAEAITESFHSGRHLLVQAGTGTGKSLGYLAPALIEVAAGRTDRVVVATATLALQAQLASKDIPAALDAVEAVTDRRPTASILKGRTNYACRLRVNGGAESAQGSLIDAAELAESLRATMAGQPEPADDAAAGSALGVEVLALREWAETEHERRGLADRDDAPSHTERAWQQVSIPVRECLGIQACPFGDSCFVERSREKARAADLVVTNHALLAIDAMHGRTALPEHSMIIIDEAHELVSRVTGAASAELHPTSIERVGRRALNYLEDDLALDFLESADALRNALDGVVPERIEDPQSPVIDAAQTIRAAARRVVSELTNRDKDDNDRKQAAAAVKEIFDVAERICKLDEHDVIWVADSDRTGRDVRVAPLTVAGLMRDRVFSDRTVVMTSATLKLGGDFTGVAASVGLRGSERDDQPVSSDQQAASRQASVRAGEHAGAHDDLEEGIEDDLELDTDVDQGPAPRAEGPLTWRGLDVGSPFDYRRQGIMYVARNMPRPGRDGLSEEAMAEIAELVWAAGGRTLGLFSSRRAAEAAAVYVRKQLPKMTILCQGDAQLSDLTKRFIENPEASLFGTLSLWQGVDVPGDTCQLVIIDRIPFPRPDEPLTVARQRAVTEAGGNGFMSVAATHAALLLAQGAGRLIRRGSDRGVVAVLDPRLATARYGGFLRSSMPDMWPTSDRELVIGALRRLN